MNVKITCPTCPNKLCFVQQYCSTEWIRNVDSAKEQTLYKKGQFIFREGDPVLGLFFIQSGKVKIVSAGRNKQQHVVRLATDGHILGHRGRGSERYPIGAIAIDDTLACFLKNDPLHEVLMANPSFTYGLMMFYSAELRKTELRLKNLAQMSIREKVADSLLYLYDVFGINYKEKSLNVQFSRQEIADISGTNAEQVTRQLTVFENENLISKKGKQIILEDVERLKKIIANYDNEFKPGIR